MAYSRWGPRSRWYTFWTCVGSGDTKESQCFDCDCSGRASYREMVDDFDGTLDRLVKESEADDFFNRRPTTDEERRELARLMRVFMEDMDRMEDAGMTAEDWAGD